MWKTCEIMHRDISLGNLMYREVMVSGEVQRYGVINDWDLAFCTALDDGNTGPSSKHRSGTIPYCAITRLKPNSPHTLGQDMEAFFWSLLVAATCTIPKGKDVTVGPIDIIDWFECEPRAVRGSKMTYIEDFCEDNKAPKVKAGFPLTAEVLLRWGRLIQRGHGSKKTPGGPHIPHQTVEQICKLYFGPYTAKKVLSPALRYEIA